MPKNSLKFLQRNGSSGPPEQDPSGLEEENRKLRAILEISKIIGSEIHLDNLLQIIIKETTRVMDADRSSLFLIDYHTKELWSKVAQGIHEYEEIRFPMDLGIAGAVATWGKVINIPDAYQDSRFNKEIDARTGYRTRSILCMPIKNTTGKIIGVIQVLNKKTGFFTPADEDFLEALTSQAGISLENAALYKEIEDLFEEIVTTIVTALEARDQTTAGHTKRVALLTLKMAKAIHNSDNPPFATIRYSPDQFKRLRYAALLHDIGKIGINENILNKTTRLTEGHMLAISERFKGIRYYLLNIPSPTLFWQGKPLGQKEEIGTLLTDLLRFLLDLNLPTRMNLTPEEIAKLDSIKESCYLDEDNVRVSLLTDHEYLHLSIPAGNITEEERDHIRSHVAKSYIILNQIQWPDKFRELPLIAASHHEYLDGTGYPHHLKDGEIPFDSKIMAIADIYDALTSRDRPYKPQIPHEKAAEILKNEAEHNRIDKAILQLFLAKKLYLLSPEDYRTYGMKMEIIKELYEKV